MRWHVRAREYRTNSPNSKRAVSIHLGMASSTSCTPFHQANYTPLSTQCRLKRCTTANWVVTSCTSFVAQLGPSNHPFHGRVTGDSSMSFGPVNTVFGWLVRVKWSNVYFRSIFALSVSLAMSSVHPMLAVVTPSLGYEPRCPLVRPIGTKMYPGSLYPIHPVSLGH